MPYKEFVPRDTLEEALSKLWGAAQEFIPTTRLEEIICKIAEAQPTGGGGGPDVSEASVGDLLTVAYGDEIADIAIPAQDITFNGDGESTGFDTDWTAAEWQTKFVTGTTISAVINGQSYSGTVELDDVPHVYFEDVEDDWEISVELYNEGPSLFGPSGETFSIAVGFKEKVVSGAPRSSVIMVVEDVNADGTLNKTWQEIHDAIAAGVPVYVRKQINTTDIHLISVASVSARSSGYNVTLAKGDGYRASDPDGYPAEYIG